MMYEVQGLLDLLMDSNVNLKVNVTRDAGAKWMFCYKDHMETLYFNIRKLN